MANSSDEYWSIDGTSLHQYGWSVATLGGSRYDLPPRRGTNMRFAYRPGEVHRAKVPDARTVDLVMWVTATDPATGATVADPKLRWNDSWEFLRRLVWKPAGTQVTVTRRWYLTVGGVKTLVTADAKAEIADTMAPTMTGRLRATFTMRLLLADPYFYGPQITVTIPSGTPTTVTNPGSDSATFSHFEIDFDGALSYPTLTNETPSTDVLVSYGGAVGSGHTLTLDVGGFRATYDPAGSGPSGQGNAIGLVSHSGARSWMTLLPGSNLLTLTGTGGGSAEVRFRPPYV